MALLRPSPSGGVQIVARSATFESLTLPTLPRLVKFPWISASNSSWEISNRRIAGSQQKLTRWRNSRQVEQLLGYSYSSFKRIRRAESVLKALQGAGRSPRRLVDVIRAIPRLSKEYFKSPFRRALYGGISLLGGFYVAQTISLSFGALGVNDVIAAAMCVLFAEYVTRYYYTREKVSFTIALLNNFKMGFTYGLFIDAFKLAS